MIMKYLLFISTLIFSLYSVAEEYTISGFEILTEEQDGIIQQGNLIVDTSLPNLDVLTIPYWFEGDSASTELTVSFMGEQLNVIQGFPFIQGEVGYLSVDISAQLLLSGELNYQLTSEKEVSLILISEIAATEEPVTEEPEQNSSGGSIGLSIIWLALLATFRRRYPL